MKIFLNENQNINFNRLKSPDKELALYCYNKRYKRDLYPIFNMALQKYGNKDQITLYRGLNFDTKNQYDDFIKSIKNNTIYFNDITSWTDSYSTANDFSRIEQSFDLNPGLAYRYQMMHDKGEYVSGYRGVVLSTTIGINQAVDLRKFKYKVENELLLPSGTYKINYSDILSYSDSFNDNFINSINNNDSQEFIDRLNFIIKNKQSNQIPYNIRKDLYNKWISIFGYFKYNIEVFNFNIYDIKSTNCSTLKISSNLLIDPDIFNYFIKDDINKYLYYVNKNILSLFSDASKIYLDNLSSDKMYLYFETPLLKDYIKLLGLDDNFCKLINNTIGIYNKQQFNDVNDYINLL